MSSSQDTKVDTASSSSSLCSQASAASRTAKPEQDPELKRLGARIKEMTKAMDARIKLAMEADTELLARNNFDLVGGRFVPLSPSASYKDLYNDAERVFKEATDMTFREAFDKS